jgi:hypothetical protein
MGRGFTWVTAVSFIGVNFGIACCEAISERKDCHTSVTAAMATAYSNLMVYQCQLH